MKHLQNNFTTPEQSERLLELGLPTDSADCYYYIQEINGRNVCVTPYIVDFRFSDFGIVKFWEGRNNSRYIPCWSVGRLIEIITICDTKEEWEPTFEPDDNILEMVFDFISENHNNRLDFSKLED